MPTRLFGLGYQGKVSRYLTDWSDCVGPGWRNSFLRCSCQCSSIHLGLQPVSSRPAEGSKPLVLRGRRGGERERERERGSFIRNNAVYCIYISTYIYSIGPINISLNAVLVPIDWSMLNRDRLEHVESPRTDVLACLLVRGFYLVSFKIFGGTGGGGGRKKGRRIGLGGGGGGGEK